MNIKKFNTFFNPKSIAVIGATDNVGHVGNSLMNNLLSGGFEGKIYPVNKNHERVMDMACYPSVSKIPEIADLALIATPALSVPEIVDECGQFGIQNIIIISSGFKESGENGKELYRKLEQSILEYSLNILGPNCLGFIKPSNKINASFASRLPYPGKIAFISQSGALGSAVLDWSIKEKVGFSYFISLGEVVDIGFSDLIDFLGNDPETSSILIYMESLSRARKFLSAARAYARSKPIVILKAGKSLEGAKAALSHTGSMAGNDLIFDAAFKRAGLLRVSTINQLFNCAKALDMQKKPEGKRLAIVTNAGGPGVLATDQLISLEGEIATLTNDTISKLNGFLPANWSHGNPVDILGDADSSKFAKALDICLKDENVDGVLTILTPQAMTDAKKTAEEIIQIGKNSSKTILASFMGDGSVATGKEILENGRIPNFDTPEEAIKTFMYMYNFGKNLESLYETPATIPHAFTPDTSSARKYIEELIKNERYTLTEMEAMKMLRFYGIPVTPSSLAKLSSEAVEIASRIGFPIAMKIVSPDILHKTEAHGIKLNVKNAEEAKETFENLMKGAKEVFPEAKITGVLLEKMVTKKYELFFGCKKDPIFGPAIIFGMGGVAVEIFNDINVALPPLNMALAKRLIEGTKIYKLLKGYRNIPGVDLSALEFILYKFAYLIMDFPEISEIDINPFVIDEKEGVVLDAKIVLDKNTKGKTIKPYSHLVISPYPRQYLREFNMINGQSVLLRPIKPEDEKMEAEMFTHFSADTQRFRFFSLIKGITHEMLIRYTQIDYDREMAIIAEIEEDGVKKMAGVVRIISDAYNESAEFALVIADPWQGKGLGNAMTDYILEIAKEKGIKKIYAYLLDDNKRMSQIFTNRGFVITPKEGNLYAELSII
jgi:acetyltransferase